MFISGPVIKPERNDSNLNIDWSLNLIIDIKCWFYLYMIIVVVVAVVCSM